MYGIHAYWQRWIWKGKNIPGLYRPVNPQDMKVFCKAEVTIRKGAAVNSWLVPRLPPFHTPPGREGSGERSPARPLQSASKNQAPSGTTGENGRTSHLWQRGWEPATSERGRLKRVHYLIILYSLKVCSMTSTTTNTLISSRHTGLLTEPCGE